MWLTHITIGQVQNYYFRCKLCACLVVMFNELFLNLISAVNYIWVESITSVFTSQSAYTIGPFTPGKIRHCKE